MPLLVISSVVQALLLVVCVWLVPARDRRALLVSWLPLGQRGGRSLRVP